MAQHHSFHPNGPRRIDQAVGAAGRRPPGTSPGFPLPLATSLELAAELRIRIARGDWIEGEKLPSVRRISEETGLHRLTVYKAYGLLKEEGLLESREKSGYYLTVSRRPVDAGFGSLDGFRRRSGEEAASDDENEDPPLPTLLGELHSVDCSYHFSQALIDPLLLPNTYLAEEAKRVFDLYPRVLGTYAPLRGDAELLNVLRRYLSETCGFVPEGQELLVTGGAQEAIHLTCEALVRPGDAVLVEQPSYSVAIEIFKHRNARLLPIEIHPDGYRLDELEELMRRHRPVLFYLNPTFHNPTGRCVPAEQRKQLADLAETYGCILVEDDAFRDVYFGDPPPPPVYSYDTAGNTIYVRSFSKYIFPGLRIGCLAARSDLMRRLLTAKARSVGGTPLLNQKVFAHHFQSERSRRHLHKLRTALQLRKEAMENALEDSGWTWHSPAGGLNLWVELPEGVDPERLLADALDGQAAGLVAEAAGDSRGRSGKLAALAASAGGFASGGSPDAANPQAVTTVKSAAKSQAVKTVRTSAKSAAAAASRPVVSLVSGKGDPGGDTVSFVPGSFFDPAGRPDRHIRLSYSQMDERRIAQGIALLRGYADRQLGK
ncbi:PLP-dependent aminotransferase family protein [Saccharibacillus brassicae]|uniref:aminotransferase-like domain-containing protein n=1 Tax=Saccharibacillus brassicae TaxID=2583377 RepID=UPI001FE52371|nr:PLP-dependent aminotransferase family protein [Saccharibacillus brassicae]